MRHQSNTSVQLSIKNHRSGDVAPNWADDVEGVFARPAFYAEFAPHKENAEFVDFIYVLKDDGQLTESRMSFASPLRELAFIFRQGEARGKVVFNEPTLDRSRKGRAFFGWIVGVKFKPTWPGSLNIADPTVVACRDTLARAVDGESSCSEILATVDRTLLSFSSLPKKRLIFDHPPLGEANGRVSDLAIHAGQSVRTLQRRVRSTTGCPPKRFLALQRFRRSLYEIAAGGEGLSAIASDLGYSDQAHLTREFRRHSGSTPGAFRQSWCRPRAQTVRFLQDGQKSSRLTMAVWPLGTTTDLESST